LLSLFFFSSAGLVRCGRAWNRFTGWDSSSFLMRVSPSFLFFPCYVSQVFGADKGRGEISRPFLSSAGGHTLFFLSFPSMGKTGFSKRRLKRTLTYSLSPPSFSSPNVALFFLSFSPCASIRVVTNEGGISAGRSTRFFSSFYQIFYFSLFFFLPPKKGEEADGPGQFLSPPPPGLSFSFVSTPFFFFFPSCKE